MSSQLHHVLVQQRAAAATFVAERDGPQRPSARCRSAQRSRPIVYANPEPTAHPALEAWPALTARRSLVVLPSRAVDRWCEPPAETQAYEERLLSTLFELRDPRLTSSTSPRRPSPVPRLTTTCRCSRRTYGPRPAPGSR